MAGGYEALSEKERETLRLILHGHDAKSMAIALDLSVHTVNERLRNARRKLAVTSSKEAARLLFERESEGPHFLGHKTLGDAADGGAGETGGRAWISRVAIIAGVCIMSLVLAALALGFYPNAASETPPRFQMAEGEAEAAARQWLELGDAGDAGASYALTARAFREANTQAVWANALDEVRAPLGATLSRNLISAEMPPTPQGYVVVKYRTTFDNRAGAVETVSLLRENGEWRVAGIYVE
ncbi:DUF4019 domain-containing protein [Erythrobacter arachoides]|uniref:DUF4019 domain-containing protein n=1 Tax=Aurantiacibacter arachoides TaxID=1850444 RepID=A0A845A4F7_9SPHN|nr:DUF4019 domain-containing protein [Aurantiacibacter arachoides]MXO94788.1 DUF4019 domain-containing protein [Aurantiacibacter arachoides]GGD60694.1 hypothetical protein GCM10011411_21120 [Aurantiacibacter arachoides]